VELGAEFIHGRSHATFALLERAGLSAMDAPREHSTSRDGKLEPGERLFSEVRAAISASDALRKRDLPFQTFLDRHLKSALSEGGYKFALMLVQGFDAADPRRASARAIVEEWCGGGSAEAPQFRPLGGYGAMLDALAAELNGSRVRLQLQTVVRAVTWKRGAVEASGSFLGAPFEARARQAIVALPLGVLQRRDVRFSPSLETKRQALKELVPGPALKVVLRFRRAFWEELDEGRYTRVSFFHAPDAPFPTFWTALPVRTPLLVAWAAGPRAERLSGKPKAQTIRAALQSLESVFGVRADVTALFESAWLHDWQSDPFARGAYSYVAAGGESAREALAKPIRDTLFFAGEAADTQGEAGTVGGALQSGIRAARELLKAK
jgi:monoamine oxidase